MSETTKCARHRTMMFTRQKDLSGYKWEYYCKECEDEKFKTMKILATDAVSGVTTRSLEKSFEQIENDKLVNAFIEVSNAIEKLSTGQRKKVLIAQLDLTDWEG